ncbi:MAG: hypothetical protein ACM3X3_09460 [Betaproteobacteria bacterium]
MLSALAVSAAGLAPSGAGAGVGVFGGWIPVGIWIDIASIPRDRGEIRKMADDLTDMGVLDVCAEVFNRGLTIPERGGCGLRPPGSKRRV